MKTIMQLVPCTQSYLNVFRNYDGSYTHELVDYLALCDDGEIRSLTLCEGYMELADESSDFIGLYGKHDLGDFPQKLPPIRGSASD